MTIGKNTKKTQVKEPVKEPVKEYDDSFETKAVIKPINVFDRDSGEYTEEINQKSVKVETWVSDIKMYKPETIGYINISTMEKFLNGEVKMIPIKMKKRNE